LLSDQTRNAKHYDGNYVVLKTILHLKEDSQTGNSFLWTPCLDFFGRDGFNHIKSDIDILVIQNGKLIIGEAKMDAKEFNLKVKNSLIWMGDNLMPDKIIVSCHTGDIEKVAKEVQARLVNKNCEVIFYKIYSAWYHFPGIFGVGTPNEEDLGNHDSTKP
jgi:hypothetical protein